MTKEEFFQYEKTSKDSVDLKRIYIDIAGDIVTGVLLSQIIFYYLPDNKGKTKLRVMHDNELWLAKTREEWWEECRISPKQFDRSIKILEDKQLVITKTIKFNGSPVKHIRLNLDILIEQIELFDKMKNDKNIDYKKWIKSKSSNLPKEENGFSPKGDIKINQTKNSKENRFLPKVKNEKNADRKAILPKEENEFLPKGKIEIDQKAKTITETTNRDYLLPDSVSLSSRSSDNKLVTSSKLSLQDVSVLCSSTKIDNHSTYIPPKDTVSIIYNKPDISLDKTLSLKPVIEPDISFKEPVVEPCISLKEFNIEPAVEPVNKPVTGTIAMLKNETGKILNNNLNEPVDELDIEPEMSFDVPDSELDDVDEFFERAERELENMPSVSFENDIEYTEEELEEILKKLNAGSSLNASCSEKKSNFERSGKILNNEQNKPKKDLFKPFSFDDFFGTSDNENLKVAPDISRVLASKKQNNTSESETGKNLNNNLNKPEKDTNSVSDTPDNALSESFDFDDDLFELDDELFESEKQEAINAMPNPDDAPNASLETSHSDPDKEPETSLNTPEREPERNVIIPDADLIELENEPAGMDAEQTLQDSTDLQECLYAEDTSNFTSAAEKTDCDTDSHVLHVLDKADVNKDSCDAFLSDLSDDVVKILAKDKLSDADIKILEEAGFSVVGELDNTMQPDAKNVPEKHVDSTEQDFVKMLEEAFNAKAVDDAEGDVNSASDMPEKHADNTEQELVRMLENAFDAKVIDDTESNIANVANDAEKPDIKPVDKIDVLPERLLSEPEKVTDADKPDKMPIANSGRSFNEPDKVLVDDTDEPDKVRKAKVISLADRRYQKSLRQTDKPEKLLEKTVNRRQSQIAFVNRHTNALQECPSCNADSLTTAVGKRVSCTGFEGLELAVNAGMRKRKSISSGSPPAKEMFRNLLVVSKQEHRKMTFACEGGN
ncbi:hypothetical protein PQ692_10315 [Thermoanaerobacterium thermosaccharolyticum]|uniref:hypothetical protein n=1 Tax=Thermoanaerobacterium thermosaccharolyticum TaxID=1517 RepID=UPI003D26DBE6